MQYYETWCNNTDDVQKIISWHAYLDSTKNVILSKNIRNENGILQFENSGVPCKQLHKSHTSSELYALFENGKIEVITTYEDTYDNCTIKSLNLLEDIIVIKQYKFDIWTLSSTGTIAIGGNTMFMDSDIINIDIFTDILILFYNNNEISAVRIVDHSKKSSIDISFTECFVYDEMLKKNKGFIKSVWFCWDVMLLVLHSGEVLCTHTYEGLKTTDYYKIIRIDYDDRYYYLGISDFYIYHIKNSPKECSVRDSDDIDKYTTETCCDFNISSILKNIEFCKKLQYKYIYTSNFTSDYTDIILVMMDDTIKTFIDVNGSNTELFDVFESYPKLYSEFNGSYI